MRPYRKSGYYIETKRINDRRLHDRYENVLTIPLRHWNGLWDIAIVVKKITNPKDLFYKATVMMLMQNMFRETGGNEACIESHTVTEGNVNYLFIDTSEESAVGFCITGGNMMTYCWIHPTLRRKGLISRFIDYFKMLHEKNIVILTPNKNMMYVLNKLNDGEIKVCCPER